MVIIITYKKIVAGEISAYQNQVEVINIDAKTKKTVHNAAKTVKNYMHAAILAAVDNVVTPRVELTVRSITGSSGPSTKTLIEGIL